MLILTTLGVSQVETLIKVNSALTLTLTAQNGLMYTCRADGLINCYNLSSNELVKTFEGHKGTCFSIVFKDDLYLFSSGTDKLIKKWNVKTGKSELVFQGSS
jgi:WD40 repeat protein